MARPKGITIPLVLQSEGRLDVADADFKRALSIRERVLAPDDPELAESLEDYAARTVGRRRLRSTSAPERSARKPEWRERVSRLATRPRNPR